MFKKQAYVKMKLTGENDLYGSVASTCDIKG